jgi:Flp pilus assembly protein TadD
MAKRTARKGKIDRITAANERAAVLRDQATGFGPPDLLILVGLAAITFGIYAQVVGHQFITLDDDSYISDNPIVNRGLTLAGLTWAFTTFHAGNWHPLTWIAHMTDSQLFGMKAGAHLVVNALMHTANTLLVFRFLLRTTRARWPSALIAALFALHPLHVESVAWAAERKDTLSAFFGLLSLNAYTRYSETHSRRWYASAGVTLALGLMAKPMLVTWPFVMLLVDYWPLRRFAVPTALRRPAGVRTASSGRAPEYSQAATTAWLVIEKIPLFALVAASAVITSVAQSRGGAVRTLAEAGVALRLSNAVVSYAKYVLLTFWPHDLAVYYPFPPGGIPDWQISGAVFLLIGITALCFFQRRTRPYLIVGWLWFLGTLVPVIGFVQVGGQTMADRYFYIPSIGLFIALVFGLADIANSWRVAPAVSAGIAGGVLMVLGTLTYGQIRLWSNSFTLLNHALEVTPLNQPAEYYLGVAMAKSGRYNEAAAHFEKAVQIQPDLYDGLFNMAVVRSLQGQLPEAIEYFQAAIRSRPDAPKAHVQLALALWKQNRDENACDELRRASELAPKDADIRTYLGNALARLGRIPEAIEQLHVALQLNPNSAMAHNNLGLALLTSGKTRESIPEFQAALRLSPELKGAADNLRRAQAQLSSQR